MGRDRGSEGDLQTTEDYLLNSNMPVTPMDYQRKLMDAYLKIDSPITNTYTNTDARIPPTTSNQEAWNTLRASMNPRDLLKHLADVMESEDYIIDGGAKHVMINENDVKNFVAVLEVMQRLGAPDQTRKRLTMTEIRTLLENVDRAMGQNALRNMPTEYTRLIPVGMDPRLGGAIIVAISVLHMLP